MDFYMQANAAESAPKLSTLTEKGHFTSGSPELAIPPSTPGAAWFESVTSEIVNAIKELGVTPDKYSLNQLATSILTLKFPTGTAFEYLRDKNYSKNDIVFTNERLYLCMANNGPDTSVVVPGTDDNVWQKIPLKQDVLALVPDATTTVKGIVQLCDDIEQNTANRTMAVTPHAVAAYVSAGGKKANDIGIAGRQGFGVSFPDATEDELARIGLTPMNGTYDKTSDNYGNFMSDLGGQFVYTPRFYVRYGKDTAADYDVYGANVLETVAYDAYNTEEEANADGFFTPRGFYDGSETERTQGFFIQKYEPNGKTLNGTVYAYGNGDGRGLASIQPEKMMEYARNLGSDYCVASFFMHQAREIILQCQAQHSTGIANCAWWKSRGGANYPNLGWSKTNSQLYSDNGQLNGVMALNAYLWEFCLGVTTAGATATQGQTAVKSNRLYLLKPTVRLKDVTSGFSGAVSEFDAWGTDEFLQNKYDIFDTTDHFILTTSRTWYWGNNGVQMYTQPVKDGVLDKNLRDAFMLIPNSESSVSTAYNTAMGGCRSYTNPTTQNLSLYLHGDTYNSNESDNVFSRNFHHWRTNSHVALSFRSGIYLR